MNVLRPRRTDLGLKITVWVPQVTSRVTFGTEIMIMNVVSPRRGPPPSAGGTLFAHAYVVA